ncbi:MAG: AtpZ/AtpI family protein [Deltaproteobacteria bacterium]|nr:AtpZ/AtpI family protein [Deltaproteobacteria bacterium]
MKNDDQKDISLLTLGVYGAVGFQLAIAVVGGWFLGNYLDGRWQTSPWLALIGLTGGFVGGLVNLVRILQWHQNRKNSLDERR